MNLLAHDTAPRSLGIAAAGTLALGLAVALPGLGDGGAATLPLQLLLVVGQAVLVTSPALLIALALVKAGPGLAPTGAAILRGLEAAGMALLGCAPAAAFVCATQADGDHRIGFVAGGAAVLAAALLFLRRVHDQLQAERGFMTRTLAVILGWAVLLLGIGAIDYIRLFFGGEK